MSSGPALTSTTCHASLCTATGRVPSTSRRRLREGPYSRTHSSTSTSIMHRASDPSALPLCTLPPEQCPIGGEVCDSDCWTTQDTAVVCAGADHCVVVPCNEPLAKDCPGACETTCDQWMDWLACDGTTCYAPPSDVSQKDQGLDADFV